MKKKKDSKGELHARFDTVTAKVVNAGALQILDDTGKPRIIALVNENMPMIMLNDQDDVTRMQAALNENGLPAIWFNDKNKTMRAAIMVRECGHATFTMFDADLNPRLVIGIDAENQYRISIFNENGETVLALPQKKEGV